MIIRFERPPIEGRFAFYTLIVYLVPILFFGYNLYYSIRSLRRITHYSHAVKNYSADEGRSSQSWLRLLVFIALSSLPLALIPSVIGPGFFFNLLLTIIGMSAIVFKDVILTYNTITRNYVLIHLAEKDKVEVDEKESMIVLKKGAIDKIHFEKFILSHKPFLNPEFRITDIASALGTNRTYLSTFINSEYGMNFSRYINSLKLEELNRIRQLSEFARMVASL